MAKWLVVPAGFIAGTMVSAQSRITAALAERVDGGVAAALISFVVGLALISVVALAVGPVRRAVKRIPHALREGRLSWWQVLGGLGGAWLVATQGLVVPMVGVTVYIIAVVAGQVVGSLAVDRLGMSPAGSVPVTVNRVVAALLAVIAVAAVGVANHEGGGFAGAALLAAVIAMSAGAGTAVQQAVNSEVAVTSGQPLAATVVNFVAGALGLALVFGVLAAFGSIQVTAPPMGPWWLYLSGPIGVGFIAVAAWAVRTVGVLIYSLLVIAGQVCGAIAVDAVAPSTGVGLHPLVGAGVLLIAVAVWLATRGLVGRDPLRDRADVPA